MQATLNQTPRANRTHIGFFGKMNSGKSSLINALANQEISIVSDVSGTTTDPVKKSMEIHGIGPCVLVDTAGFDDIGSLGEKRIALTEKAAKETDIAVILFQDYDMEKELSWYRFFKEAETPVLAVISKIDVLEDADALEQSVKEKTDAKVLKVSSLKREGVEELKNALIEALPKSKEKRFITGNLVSEGDTVLLIMPQDIQAPEGRLILPQVQTIRELLDKKCLVMSATTDKLEQALAAMAEPPKLIITDSQVYKTVYEKKPKESKLTSFSTLFAAYKGDISYYIEGAKAIETLTENSKVLIAECCTHAPLKEDIGREKLPRLLRKKVGENLTIDIVGGADFPADLSGYDLVIQCGACMFNRKYVMSRINEAKKQEIPMSNYGIVIAYLNGILDKITVPKEESLA